IPGSNEFAVDFAGYVFLCAGEEQMRRFCQWPKRFLTEAPRINAPGLALGFGLLSPCGFRAAELAKRTQGSYGFDIVDVVALLERAMKQPAMPEPPFPSGEDEAELPPMPAPG
ncbi:ML3, partial [Symbiodinium sp. CCMP2456]